MSRQEKSLFKPNNEKLTGEPYRQLIERVFQRDRWTCRNPFCQAMKSLTPHHIQKRSQLGGDEIGNPITLCSDCHDRVERNQIRIEVVDVMAKFHVEKE
jgi:hypothetical protein